MTQRLVLNSRPAKQAKQFSDLLKERKLEVFEFPLLEIVPIEKQAQELLAPKIGAFKPSDWVLFSSANGVRSSVEIFGVEKLTAKIAAIGHRTASVCREFGLEASFVSNESNSEAFAKEFIEHAGEDCGELTLLRGEAASDVLPEALKQSGFILREFSVYHSICPSYKAEELERLAKMAGLVDGGKDSILLTFSSSLALKNFVDLLKGFEEILDENWLSQLKNQAIAVLGTTTKNYALSEGFNVCLISKEPTMESFAEGISEYLGLE